MAATTLLGIEDLALYIGSAVIVDGVSLEVADGECLGLIGPNGAGKTSLFNLLSGLVPASRGRIRLAGQDLAGASASRRARAGLGRTFQTSSVFAGLTVAENVRLAAEARIGGSLRLWRRAARFRPAAERAGRALEQVGLFERSDQRAAQLSHGEKRKLDLAIALATEPRLLLLDEPLAGLSVEDVPPLVELIRQIAAEPGRTVIMVEHHMPVVLGLCDRVAVMHHGSLLACDAPAAVAANATVQEAYLGEPL